MRRPLLPLALLVVATGASGGCMNDPVYIPGPMNLEAGVDDGTGALSEATAQLQLPINLETEADAAKRANRAEQLGIAVPYVKLGDLEISVEWTVRNLDLENEGTARVQMNGANENFAYDPSILTLVPDDEDIEAPPFDGDVPIHIPPGGSFSGVFREDAVREAAIDLEQITRANVNPFTAMLTFSKNAEYIQPLTPPVAGQQQQPVGDPIPREAFAQLVRIDLRFRPDRHMVLEYTVRVRDVRGIVNTMLMNAPAEELATFAPATYGG
ncbi:MAG: hypothetical protein KF773_15625 [Deltaproteobacteria bacterium]|nr:hypothetical protein [Deltaproteobacteria bacterium]MCW5802650.1 hypothetical protein [Deltaproteobacteria bacterium]